MTNQVTNYCGDIKSIAANTDGTPTQKLIAVLRHCGVETTAELAAIIGVGERAIQKANSSSVERTTVREPEFVSEPQFANSSSETNHSSSLARVEDNNINTNPKISVEVIPPVVPQTVQPAEPKRRRGTFLPDDFELPEDWAAWTRTNCPSSTPERLQVEALKFANHWQSKPGAAGRKVNWFKTWQNWCLTSFGTAPARPNAAQAVDWKEAKREKDREFMREMGLL